MAYLLSGKISMTEEFVNRLITELTKGTEYADQFHVSLVGGNKVAVELRKPICDVDGVSLTLSGVQHNLQQTLIQFKLDDVTTKSILMKPLIGMLKSKLISWVLQKVGAIKMRSGIQVSVSGETINLEIREWLQRTEAGSLDFPVLGKLIDTMEIVSARIDSGEVIVEAKVL